jgi:hypothetical protein
MNYVLASAKPCNLVGNYQHPMVEVADLSDEPVNVTRLHGATPKI